MIAALSLIGVLIGAALQYAFGQRLEARKQLGVQRAQACIDFFRAVSALAQGRSKEQLALAADAKARICVYGSVAVVQRLGDFERAGAIVANSGSQAALIQLMQAMREDVTGSAIPLRQEDLMHILFGRDTSAR
ncbi:MAG TPA: hypothetical protein VND19_03640 [Acetobacteraceae bacterium]|nr:hypothetical protein [Acetobacteraceae bacterium]